MKTRTLHDLIDGLYADNIVRAYIYYGEVGEARDHKNRPLGSFMQDKDRDSLKDHLQDIMMPEIQAKLNATPYQIIDIDYLNNAPHPHFIIARKDKLDISAEEKTKIKSLLVKILNQLNAKDHDKDTVSDQGMFSGNNNHERVTSSRKQTRYDLRPRSCKKFTSYT